MGLRPDRFCNAVHTWCLQHIHSEEDLAQFDYHLNDPPLQARVTEAVIAAEMDSFAAFAGAFGVKAPAAR